MMKRAAEGEFFSARNISSTLSTSPALKTLRGRSAMQQ
jgi:hypothetical protein